MRRKRLFRCKQATKGPKSQPVSVPNQKLLNVRSLILQVSNLLKDFREFPFVTHINICAYSGTDKWDCLDMWFVMQKKGRQLLVQTVSQKDCGTVLKINLFVYLQGRETDKNWKMVTVPQFCDSWYPGMLVCEHSVMPCSRAKIQKR